MEKRCANCNEPMNLLREGAKYCSGRCRVAVHRRKPPKPPFPHEMVERSTWVRAEGKRPLMASGGYASSTDPATWSTYSEAKEGHCGDGLGFMLGGGIGCVDLDGSLIDGKLTTLARRHIRMISERVIFCEVSQSGRGVHIFIEAPESKGTCRPGYERYTRDRFIRVTGNEFKLR